MTTKSRSPQLLMPPCPCDPLVLGQRYFHFPFLPSGKIYKVGERSAENVKIQDALTYLGDLYH